MVNYRLSIRKIERTDIPYLVQWANNHTLTKGFHGYLPSSVQEGNQWFQRSLLDKSREDFVIYAAEESGDRYPIGMLGLCNIDDENRKAEYYVIIGNTDFQRRGIAFRTSNEMIANTYFKSYNLNKIYAMVDKENYFAQKLVEKLGFRREGILTSDLILPDKTTVDRIYYALLASDRLS